MFGNNLIRWEASDGIPAGYHKEAFSSWVTVAGEHLENWKHVACVRWGSKGRKQWTNRRLMQLEEAAREILLANDIFRHKRNRTML